MVAYAAALAVGAMAGVYYAYANTPKNEHPQDVKDSAEKTSTIASDHISSSNEKKVEEPTLTSNAQKECSVIDRVAFKVKEVAQIIFKLLQGVANFFFEKYQKAFGKKQIDTPEQKTEEKVSEPEEIHPNIDTELLSELKSHLGHFIRPARVNESYFFKANYNTQLTQKEAIEAFRRSLISSFVQTLYEEKDKSTSEEMLKNDVELYAKVVDNILPPAHLIKSVNLDKRSGAFELVLKAPLVGKVTHVKKDDVYNPITLLKLRAYQSATLTTDKVISGRIIHNALVVDPKQMSVHVDIPIIGEKVVDVVGLVAYNAKDAAKGGAGGKVKDGGKRGVRFFGKFSIFNEDPSTKRVKVDEDMYNRVFPNVKWELKQLNQEGA